MRSAIQFDIVVDGVRVPCAASAEAVAYARRTERAANETVGDDSTDPCLRRLKREAIQQFLRGATPPVLVLHAHLRVASR